jgi:hypothetical protein
MLGLDQSLDLEQPDRLAHGRSAGAEAVGKLLLPDPLSRLEPAAKDVIRHLVRDPRHQRRHSRRTRGSLSSFETLQHHHLQLAEALDASGELRQRS